MGQEASCSTCEGNDCSSCHLRGTQRDIIGAVQQADDPIIKYDDTKDSERGSEDADEQVDQTTGLAVIDFGQLTKNESGPKQESYSTAIEQQEQNVAKAEEFQALQVIPEHSHEENPIHENNNDMMDKCEPPAQVAEKEEPPVQEKWPAKTEEPMPLEGQQIQTSGPGAFKGLSKASSIDSIKQAIGEPNCWERFIGAASPSRCPFCGFVCTVSFVLLLVVMGVSRIKMSDSFGFFVLSDELTQAYFAHEEFLKDRPYFTELDTTAFQDPTVLKRSWYSALATIFLEVKGTKCPGDDCNLESKNAITAKYLGYIKQVEERIWADQTFQKKYCALLKPASTSSKCYPPKSPLSLMLWGSGVAPTEASKALAAAGYGPDPAICQSWQSPLDVDVSACSSPAWTHVNSDSGAEAPGDLQSYSSVIDKICTQNNNHWAGLQESWLPNFACANNHMRNHGVPFLRSQLLFGLPYDRDRKVSELDFDDQVDDLADDYGTDFYKLTKDIIKDVTNGDPDVNLVVSSRVSSAAEQQELQMQTLAFTAASFLLVFLYMWFNVESLFLAVFGMLQVLFSTFPTVIVWTLIDPQGVQFLQFLAVFMILGIGADDTFVLNDAWKQAKHELVNAGDLSTIHVFTMAYRRSFSSMMATTMTTAWAFFFGILNPIPAIADFCVFACIIVIFDFLFCISMFAACVAFHDRFMVGHRCCCCGGEPAPGACCAPGCCWGFTRILWRKCRSIPLDQTTDQRNLELFFSGPLFRFLLRFKYPLIIFWLLLFAGAITSIVLGVKVATKDPEGLPKDHPLQRYSDITSEYFTQQDPEKVNVVWGLSEAPVKKWSATESQEPTQIEFMDISAAVSKDGQRKILQLCQAPTAQAGSLRCYDKSSCLVKGATTACQKSSENGMSYFVDPLCQDGRYCIMEQVQEYANKKFQDTGLQMYDWPLDDFHAVVSTPDFQQYMRDWFDFLNMKKQHWHAENYKEDTGIVLEGSRVKYLWVTFNATFEGRFLPPKEGNKIYDDWEAFLNSHVDGTKYHQVHIMYLFKVLQDILVRECFKSIAAALMVAFVTLALVTWNWHIALLGLFNILSTVAYFLALWPLLDWELDIYNVIFSIMAVGLSVDYTVHILHAYNESEEIDHESRAKTALSSMGITVLSGAITTLLAAFPLVLTVPTFFNRFGKFIFIVIFFSILTSLLFLVPLLLVLGPNSYEGTPTGTEKCCKFGEIGCLHWLRGKWHRCCKNSKVDTE